MEVKDNLNKLPFPDYVSLKEKYNCANCKYRKKNVKKKQRRKHPIKYLFSTCNGNPCKRTQCKKRCWLVSDLFSLGTAAIIVIAFSAIFSHFHNFLLSLAYTIIFMVIMDAICTVIEWGIDKIFENLEISRKKKYDQKIADMEAINEQEKQEEERERQRQNELYKDINEAKSLYSEFLSDKDKLKKLLDKAERFPELKGKLYSTYKEFLGNLKNLLDQVDLKNFYYSEIRTLFQFYLPELKVNLRLYIETITKNKETESQIKEMTKLLSSFNLRIVSIQNNLNNSDAENLVYKMQALREVVLPSNNKEG